MIIALCSCNMVPVRGQVNAGGVRILLPCIKKRPDERPSDAPLHIAHGHLPERGPVGLSFSSRQPAAPLAEQAIGVLVLTLGEFKISSDAFARLQADVHAQGPLITAGQQSTGGADEDKKMHTKSDELACAKACYPLGRALC